MIAVTMTSKDKKLIYFCSLFAVAALTYMLALSPLSEEIALLTENRDSMRNYLDQVYYEASMADSYQEWMEESRDIYNEDVAAFDDVYATENADRIFTEEVISHNMLPVSFTISERDFYTRLSFYEVDAYELGLGEEGFPYSNYIYRRTVRFTCAGTINDAITYVDELKDRNGVIIKDVSFTGKKPDYRSGESSVRLSVSFDIYTYDKEGFSADNMFDMQ